MTKGTSRREFIIGTAAVGIGIAALGKLSPTLAFAAETKAPGQEQRKLPPYAEVMKKARKALYPFCRVCPVCDGVACAGEIPGIGGIGTGLAFINNLKTLNKYHLNSASLHDVVTADTSVSLFGQKLSMPIIAAPIGGFKGNLGSDISEDDYFDAVLGGCMQVGTLGCTSDPIKAFESGLQMVRRVNGKAICIIKPWGNEHIIRRMKIAEDAGAVAVGVDVDSFVIARINYPQFAAEPKNGKKLAELVKATKLPFIVKGIVTVREAKIAVEAGAAAIVIGNHGGRTVDHAPGLGDILGPIASEVKGKTTILCDSGIRYGTDVLKCLALGANAVLVGRPVIRGVFGGGQDGVAVVMNKFNAELRGAMLLTGTASVAKVDPSILS